MHKNIGFEKILREPVLRYPWFHKTRATYIIKTEIVLTLVGLRKPRKGYFNWKLDIDLFTIFSLYILDARKKLSDSSYFPCMVIPDAGESLRPKNSTWGKSW